ncbi:amylo-alpha-1,6-glucosidase [Promicromonospora sp. Populi]|uniref:amylo-alpha-1,6-glucosidase n=1 Tax=Promicromonospora sp. Populi TaxID=3239420 RepID=UPI0034E1AEE0
MDALDEVLDEVQDEVRVDVAEVPFSRRGSWLNVSTVVGPHTSARHLHLVSHRHGMHAAAEIVLFDDAGRELAPVVAATPSRLRAQGAPGQRAPGWFEVAFEDAESLRVRGHGAHVELRGGSSSDEYAPHAFTDPATGAVLLADDRIGARLRITPLEGTALRLADRGGRPVVTPEVVTPEGGASTGGAEGGTPEGRTSESRTSEDGWEIAIEEIGSAKAAYRATDSFPDVAEHVRREFAAYVDAIAPWRSPETPAATLAAYVLWSATVAPSGMIRREAVLMSKHWMDRVWSWDHCFNALALAPGLPDEALDAFEMPFDHQDELGALPDLVGHAIVSFACVKPPVHGWAFARLARLLPDLDRPALERVTEELARLTDFWLTHRRAPGHALPYYQQGNDSGWDNSTMFLRETVIEAPDLAAYLVLQLDTLGQLADRLGDRVTERLDTRRGDSWRKQRDELAAALVDQLWDGERFVARGVTDREPDGQKSLLGLMPLVAAEFLPRDVVDALIARVPDYLTAVGPATEELHSPHYRADGYWRGPVWGPSTVLLEDGLRRAGAAELADQVSARFRATCERSGFAENFDATTGAGLRDRAYTWTASSYLMLAREHVARAAG